MRIVHVFHQYYPFVGGMERVVQGLAEAQVRLGHEVHVITSNYGADGSPVMEVLNGVHIHRIKAWRLHYPDLTIPKHVPIELFKHVDIVHVHGHNSLFSLKVLEEASARGIKTVCYFMAVDVFKNHPNQLIKRLAPRFGKKNTEKALKLVNLSLVKSMRDFEVLNKVYGAKPVLLPDALPDYYFTIEKGDSLETRKKFGIKQEEFFLFIGRMHKLKGPQILVKALRYIIQNEVAIVFIGPDGGFLKETKELAEKFGAKDRIYFLGFVDETLKIHVIDAAVAVVLPSLTDYVEVYPGVISEAWAREKPVIASSVGGIPSRVKDYINGRLVQPSNPEVLADAMLEFLNNGELARKLGVTGKKSLSSWNTIATQSLQLYESL